MAFRDVFLFEEVYRMSDVVIFDYEAEMKIVMALIQVLLISKHSTIWRKSMGSTLETHSYPFQVKWVWWTADSFIFSLLLLLNVII